MRPALKLAALEQEHLQEVYDSIGVARDELPYTPEFDRLCQEFQDRAFKNAEPEQVYGAMLKYVRSSTIAAAVPETPPAPVDPERTKLIKLLLKKHGKSGKVLPYSSEFESALKEFNQLTGKESTGREFWQALTNAQGRSRKPPQRKAKVKADRDDDEGGDDE